MARERLDPETFRITPGDYVVKDPSPPYDTYVVSVYGEKFELGSRAHLFSGDSFRVISPEPAKIFYRKAPWWAAGKPGKPARPRDGSWPAFAVEIEKGGEMIQGFIPLFSFDRIAPRA